MVFMGQRHRFLIEEKPPVMYGGLAGPLQRLLFMDANMCNAGAGSRLCNTKNDHSAQ